MTPRERDVIRAIIKALESRDYDDIRAYAMSYSVPQNADRMTIVRGLLRAMLKQETKKETEAIL